MATEMIKGKPVERGAGTVTNKAGCRGTRTVCPRTRCTARCLAEEAIKAAVKDYYDRNHIPYDSLQVCGLHELRKLSALVMME